MTRLMTAGLIAALVGTVLSAAPASAQLARPQTAEAIAGSDKLTTEVRWRGGGYGWRGGGYGWRGGSGWRGYGYRGWYGPGIGFATGLAIGGAYAAPYYYGPPVYYRTPGVVYDAPENGNSVAYCMQRFKSYDPASGTYLGYDGRRHPCP